MHYDKYIDLHAHGARGKSFNSSKLDDWIVSLDHLAGENGYILATLASDGIDNIVSALEMVRKNKKNLFEHGLIGVHLEGPFISADHRGAHPAAALSELHYEDAVLISGYNDIIKMITLAPEVVKDGRSYEVMKAAGIIISAGHTDSDEVEALPSQISHIAHLWSGHSRLNIDKGHRVEGFVESVLGDSHGRSVELICDEKHITYNLFRIAAKCIDRSLLCAVSDACPGCGCPEGTEFKMGEVRGVVGDGVALALTNESLCGGILTVPQQIAVLKKWGVGDSLIRKLTYDNPARVLGYKTGASSERSAIQ